MIIDSVQTIYMPQITSAWKCKPTERMYSQLMELIKNQGIPTILVGHVTKEGAVADRGFWSIWLIRFYFEGSDIINIGS